jgi:hypothetical protein
MSRGASGGRAVTPGDNGTAADGSPQADRWKWLKNVATWAAFLAALGVLVLGVWSLLLDVFGSRQVAAPFTRVGGVTQIETAVDASRFWRTPPRPFVTIRAKREQLMLGAGLCAAVHDAPLLYTSPFRKRERVVDATIKEWSNIAGTPGYQRRNQIRIDNYGDVTHCLATGNWADLNKVSALKVSDPVVRLPEARVKQKLAKIQVKQTVAGVVVFAAPLAPGDPPDVAVGLALAAHTARVLGKQVSLVVVPRYLEADPGLEKQLESQGELVTGGVVLGQVTTVPEDTRALLRQLLTSTDRDDVLSQIQANLGSVGPLVTALLAVLALGAAARLAPEIRRQVVRFEHRYKIFDHAQRPMGRLVQFMPTFGANGNNHRPTPAGDWRDALGKEKSVTLWLSSGWEVTGTVTDWFPSSKNRSRVLQLNNAQFRRNGDRREAEWVLVPIDDIELITRRSPAQHDAVAAGAAVAPGADSAVPSAGPAG